MGRSSRIRGALRAGAAAGLVAWAWTSSAAAAAWATPAGPAPAVAAAEVEVTWRGEAHALDALPDALTEGPRRALTLWGAWAGERAYRLTLADDGRVLLLEPERSRAKRLPLVERTIALVDRWAPAPERPAAPSTPGDGEEGWSWSWSDDGPPPDTETAVLLEAREQADYVAALAHVEAREPYLRGRLGAAREMPGFLLLRPLFAAWVADAAGLEEWSPEHELVHRATHLLVARRFGPQPWWLATGIAWAAEDELAGGIYCFPYRQEFVFASEHRGWEAALRREHDDRDAIAAADLAGWSRGTWDEARAHRAYGTARFLIAHRPDALAPILADFRRLRDTDGVLRHPDGTWERIPGWEPTPDDARAILERHAGADVLDELLRYFQKGKRYRPG